MTDIENGMVVGAQADWDRQFGEQEPSGYVCQVCLEPVSSGEDYYEEADGGAVCWGCVLKRRKTA